MGEEIAAVAERLRLVRGARRKFLRMWAIDHTMIDPLVDRLVVDLGDLPPSQPPAEAGAGWPEQDTATDSDAPVVDES